MDSIRELLVELCGEGQSQTETIRQRASDLLLQLPSQSQKTASSIASLSPSFAIPSSSAPTVKMASPIFASAIAASISEALPSSNKTPHPDQTGKMDEGSALMKQRQEVDLAVIYSCPLVMVKDNSFVPIEALDQLTEKNMLFNSLDECGRQIQVHFFRLLVYLSAPSTPFHLLTFLCVYAAQQRIL
jgi:hypothetical protein